MSCFFIEFPYLIQVNPVIPDIFQKGWNEYLADSNIFLILLGSSMAIMENEVLGYRSPLYGRRTKQWLVEAMTFTAASQFRAEQPFQDKLAHFAGNHAKKKENDPQAPMPAGHRCAVFRQTGRKAGSLLKSVTLLVAL